MIGELIGGGIRLLREQTRAVVIWGGLFAVLGIVMWLVMLPAMAPFADFQQRAAQATAAGLPPPQFPAEFFITFVPIWLVSVLMIVAVFAAAVRATAWGGHDRLGFLRFGMDEFRLIGLGILAFVVFFVGALVVGIVMALVGGVLVWLMGGASTAAGGLLAIVLVLGLFALMVWLNVRLSLIAPITVLRGRIAIGDGWRATRGHFWTLFGTYAVLWLGFVVLWLIVMGITQPQLVSAMLHGFNQAEIAAANAAQMAEMSNGLSLKMILGWVVILPLSLIGYAIWFGTIATAAVRFTSADQADLSDQYLN